MEEVIPVNAEQIISEHPFPHTDRTSLDLALTKNLTFSRSFDDIATKRMNFEKNPNFQPIKDENPETITGNSESNTKGTAVAVLAIAAAFII